MKPLLFVGLWLATAPAFAQKDPPTIDRMASEPCTKTTISVQAIWHTASSTVVDRGGNLIPGQSSYFLAEPIRVVVSAGRGLPPPKHIQVSVHIDGTRVGTVDFGDKDWREVASSFGGTASRPYTAFVARSDLLVPGIQRLGSHVLAVRLEGCEDGDTTSPTHRESLEVKEPTGPKDRAAILQYRASDAAYFAGDCAAARKSASLLASVDPETDYPLKIECLCAEKAGDYKKALQILEQLQTRPGQQGIHAQEHALHMERLREKLRGK